MNKEDLIQIKNPQVKEFRDRLALKQKMICPICGGSLANGKVALDHDHEGHGALRGTLHMTCNASIGRIEEGAKRMMKPNHLSKVDFFQYLENTLNYLRSTKENPSKYVHPTFDLVKMKQKPKRRPRRKKTTGDK